jgi:hypothetical protein
MVFLIDITAGRTVILLDFLTGELPRCYILKIIFFFLSHFPERRKIGQAILFVLLADEY